MSPIAFFGETQCSRHEQMIYSRSSVQNLYISYPLARQGTPPCVSRWSRLFELRSRDDKDVDKNRCDTPEDVETISALHFLPFKYTHTRVSLRIYQSLSEVWGIM